MDKVKKDMLKLILGRSRVALVIEWKFAQAFELLNVAAAVGIIALGVQCELPDKHIFNFEITPLCLNIMIDVVIDMSLH